MRFILTYAWAGLLLLLSAMDAKAAPQATPRFVGGAACVYEENVEWRNWGAAPFSQSADDSLTDAKLDWWLGCSSIPASLWATVKETLHANPKGTETFLTPDMTLLESASGSDRAHQTQFMMRNVKVAELMVAFGIVRAATARRWQVTDEGGRVYVIVLIERCGNLTLLRIDEPPPKPAVVAEACVEVEFASLPHDVVRFAIFSSARLRASRCWELCDDELCSTLPAPCDTCSWLGPASVIDRQKLPLLTGMYTAVSARQRLRMPREAQAEFLALCIQRASFGESNTWVIPPEEWAGDHYLLSADLWPVWGK